MATRNSASTQVNWAELLRNRIKKMNPNGLWDDGLYGDVMSKRANASQSGVRNVGVSDGADGKVYNRDQVTQELQAQDRRVANSRITSALHPNGASPQQRSASTDLLDRDSPLNNIGATGSAAGGGAQQAGKTAQSGSGAAVPGAGNQGPTFTWGDPMTGLPFDYTTGDRSIFGNVPVANRENLASDPNAQRRMWVKAMGGDQTTRDMLGNFVDPEAAMFLYGGNLSNVDQKLDYADAFMDYAMSQGDVFDPRDMMGKMLGAAAQSTSTTGGLNPLTEQLGTNADAGTQVNNLLQMVDQTLQFSMSERAFGAYRALLDREAEAYMDWRMTDGAMDKTTFAQWLIQRLGPTGGL